MLIASFGSGRVAAQPAPDCDTAAASAATMLARTNEARATLGLPAYRANDTLTRIAFEHARDMAANAYFSHTGRDGRNEDARARDAGYGAGRQKLKVDEVFVARKDLDEAFQWLMSDPDHQPLLVHRGFVEVGSGAACTSYGHVWVIDFGTYEGVNDPTPVPPTTTPAAPTATPEPPTATTTASPSETVVTVATAAATTGATPDAGGSSGAGPVAAPTTAPSAGGAAGPQRRWTGLIALVLLAVVLGIALLQRAGRR